MAEINKIIVPKDKVAEMALNFDEATEDQIIKLVFSREELEKLWATGFFNIINSLTGATIDIGEDDATISDSNVLIRVLESGIFSSQEFVDVAAFQSIRDLFKEALERNTSISFYF